MRAEGEQIFRGLGFFYVPDDDVAPARRLRIRRARECGAKWVRAVREATHVVVDRGLGWEDVEGLMEKRAGGKEAKDKAVVVNEDWPLECMQFRRLLDPGQRRYLLKGQRMEELEGAGGEGSLDNGPGGEAAVRMGERHDEDTAAGEQDDKGGQEGGGDARPRDELSTWISMVQEFKDLPLDPDDDDDDGAQSTTTSAEPDQSASGSDSEETRKDLKKPPRKDIPLEDGFACHHAGERDVHAASPNARTVEVLERMKGYYERIKDPWRTLAYRKAISVLARQELRIRTREEALRLPGIGPRLADKIEEIATTARLRRLEHAEHAEQGDPAARALGTFLRIYGVGTRQAERWVARGLRTLEDVRARARLTAPQRVGLEHYDELLARIPRAEVAALGAVVRSAARRIDPAVRVVVGGSYRRGAPTSHDVDLIVTRDVDGDDGDDDGAGDGKADARALGVFLQTLTARLEADGFLVARLAGGGGGSTNTSTSTSTSTSTKWHGCCVLPGTEGPWRRIDFLAVPGREIGAAMIYFTGDDVFNRSLRLLASKKGMRLNQRGLYEGAVDRTSRSKSATEGRLIEGRDERRIFEILGVKWREPHERWC